MWSDELRVSMKHPWSSRVIPRHAADIVRDAITASGGFGEPWCLDDVSAVRVGNLMLVIEVDDPGWKRVKPGVYRSGGYVVGHLDTGEWLAEGPGVDRCFDHKHDAQAACAAARSYTPSAR